LGPKHHTRWKGEIAVTAAPDDRNRITVLYDGYQKFVSTAERDGITAIKMSTDCESVVYGTSGGQVKIFNLSKSIFNKICNTIKTLPEPHSSPVLTLDISASNVIVSGGTDHLVKIYHSEDGRLLTCSGHSTLVRDVMFISNGTEVLSCDATGILIIWDVNTGNKVREVLAGQTSHSSCINIIEGVQESLVAVAGVDKGVSVINLNTGELIKKIAEDGPEIRIARFGPTGSYLVTGHDSGEVKVWDIRTGASLLSSPLKLHESWVKDLAISKDGKMLLTVGDRLIWWSLDSLEKAKTSVPRRKLSLPVNPRSRKNSERSSCSSIHEDSFTSIHLNSVPASPDVSISVPTSPHTSRPHPPIKSAPPLPINPKVVRRQNRVTGSETPPTRPRSLYSNSPLPSPMSPTSRYRKFGRGRQKELLQTFDMKGTSADKVYVNQDFTEFVTVDDAGILYILNEYKNIPNKSAFPRFN